MTKVGESPTPPRPNEPAQPDASPTQQAEQPAEKEVEADKVEDNREGKKRDRQSVTPDPPNNATGDKQPPRKKILRVYSDAASSSAAVEDSAVRSRHWLTRHQHAAPSGLNDPPGRPASEKSLVLQIQAVNPGAQPLGYVKLTEEMRQEVPKLAAFEGEGFSVLDVHEAAFAKNLTRDEKRALLRKLDAVEPRVDIKVEDLRHKNDTSSTSATSRILFPTVRSRPCLHWDL